MTHLICIVIGSLIIMALFCYSMAIYTSITGPSPGWTLLLIIPTLIVGGFLGYKFERLI